MRESGDPGAYHITLAHAGLRRETRDTWGKVAVTYLQLAGVDPTRLAWVAYRQREIDNDHIHLVAATRSFSGRRIDLLLSAAKTDEIQADLAARLRMQAKGPPFIKLGPSPQAGVRYRRADVVAWIEQRLYASTSHYTAALATLSRPLK